MTTERDAEPEGDPKCTITHVEGIGDVNVWLGDLGEASSVWFPETRDLIVSSRLNTLARLVAIGRWADRMLHPSPEPPPPSPSSSLTESGPRESVQIAS